MTLTSRYGKFNQENTYQTLSQSASFPKRYDKTFWCVFRFTVLTVVDLQNANAKFHKVEQRHYSGDAENVYISVRQIYSGQYVPNFIRIGQVLQTVYQKHFGVFFGLHLQCIYSTSVMGGSIKGKEQLSQLPASETHLYKI